MRICDGIECVVLREDYGKSISACNPCDQYYCEARKTKHDQMLTYKVTRGNLSQITVLGRVAEAARVALTA